MSQRPVLFVGDLHLGRRAAGVGTRLEEAGVPASRASAAAVWERIVAWASTRRARAVVLAGDVVDSDQDRFEAYGRLERGVRELVGAGIAVVAVAGNHDWLVLPRLAGRVESFRLLGEGGRWELWPVPGEGPEVDLLAWSFPGRTVREDPTADPALAEVLARRRPGPVLVGLVHGDLDQPGSPYAPLDRRRLRGLGCDAWLLGHVHRPDPLEAGEPLGYLGSAAGLDPGEPGPHGPWELTVEGGGVRLRHVPLAPVRYERLEVPVDGLRDADAGWDAVRTAARDRLGPELERAPVRPEAVLLRVRLAGTVADGPWPVELEQLGTPFFELEGVPCVVERVEDATRPPVDLETLAREPSPAGEAARLLLALERAGVPPELEEAVRRSLEPWRREIWNPREASPLPPLPELLRGATWRALELLLAHRREGQG